ncbi:hypothetical protein [Chryseobacterium foetidum]|uniref:hypothetical protein n=1 Tax=Chryseobacterium foetidum TaxID=2951057 RepID=UPI0021C6B268|nr:hypothetical protein [Chryseobacterium foetidum]
MKFLVYIFSLMLIISCSVMSYKPLSQDEKSQSLLRFDGYYYSYKRISEIDSLNPRKVDIPELYPARLSTYMFSSEGKAINRVIGAEMYQIPGSSNEDSWVFDVLFGRLGWKKSDLIEEYKNADSYILNGNTFKLTSFYNRKIYQYTRECQIVDTKTIVIDQDTFKFKKYYVNFNTINGY